MRSMASTSSRSAGVSGSRDQGGTAALELGFGGPEVERRQRGSVHRLPREQERVAEGPHVARRRLAPGGRGEARVVPKPRSEQPAESLHSVPDENDRPPEPVAQRFGGYRQILPVATHRAARPMIEAGVDFPFFCVEDGADGGSGEGQCGGQGVEGGGGGDGNTEAQGGALH